MEKISLSKSKYCEAVQCEKILWLRKYRPEAAEKSGNDSVLETGREVGEAAKGLFGDYTEISTADDIAARVENTRSALEDKPNVITEASFTFNGNFCSVDILKNDADGVEIYEVKSSTEIKDIFIDDVSYQHFILSNAGFRVKKAAIVYINNEYVRGETLDLNQLFKIEDITEIAEQKHSEIESKITSVTDFMQINGENMEPESFLSGECFTPYECDFWSYCTKDLPKPNVFDIVRMKKTKKFEKYRQGKVSFRDLENDPDITNAKFKEQIDFELHAREPKIELDAIKEILDSLNYPLYFIDYETCQYAIPKYKATKPYQQIPFQYSLHIAPEPGASLIHKEFLGDPDDENIIRNFAESMIGNLSENGSVIVYNKGFESSVNRKIADMYPDLSDEITRINSNIVDLMVPFSKRQYYTREMKGSYSIKKVLPALYPDDSDLDYTSLSGVHNGSEASAAFLSLKGKSPEEQSEIRKNLLKYCELDTYAMVKIWEKFREVAGED